jgi:O-antigen/teichoic acid export membrane protein
VSALDSSAHQASNAKPRLSRLRNFIGSRFPHGSFARNTALLAGAAAGAQGLVVITSPLLTRLYSPAEFGILAVYVSFVSTLSPIGSLTFQYAIPLPADDVQAIDLLALSLIVAVAFASLVGIVGLGFGAQISEWVNTPGLQRYLWIVPLSLLGASGYGALRAWAIRKGDYRRIARTALTQSAGQVSTQLGFGWAGASVIGLLLGDAIGRTAGSATLAGLVWRRDRERVREMSWSGIRAVASRYRRFPLLSSGSLLLNNAGQNLPVLMLAGIYGPLIAGWYALSQRVLAIPGKTIGQSVSAVYIGKAAELARNKPRALKRLFVRTIMRLLLGGAVPISVIAALAQFAFPFVFGMAWKEAGVYTQILAVTFLLQFVAVPVSQTLNLIERQDLQLLWDFSNVVLTAGPFLIGAALEWSPRLSLAAYGVAMIILYLFLILLTLHALDVYEAKNATN